MLKNLQSLFLLFFLLALQCGNPNKGNFTIEEVFALGSMKGNELVLNLTGFGESKSSKVFFRARITKLQMKNGGQQWIPANGIEVKIDIPENGGKPSPQSKARIEVFDSSEKSLVYNANNGLLNPIPKDFTLITDTYGIAEFCILFPFGYNYIFNFTITAGSDYKEVNVFVQNDVKSAVPSETTEAGSSTLVPQTTPSSLPTESAQ